MTTRSHTRGGGILGGPVDGPERLAARFPACPALPGLAVAHRSSGFAGRLVALAGDEVRSKLGAAGVALCVADTAEQPATFRRTGDFAYVRLRGTGYDEKALEGWGASFRSALDEGVDVYAYLKHEDSATGPRDAAILKRMADR